MDLDWCNDENDSIYTKFNDDSIIKENSVKKELSDSNKNNKETINIEDCFDQNLVVTDNESLLNVLIYISNVANFLRNLMRNKKNKISDIFLEEDEFIIIIKYLEWLKLACENIKHKFAVPYRKDNSYDPKNKKLFKTSSYKFCNFKESCSIHRNKNKICDKNHFVFDMIINDITKLLQSLNILKLDNINHVFDNKFLLYEFDEEDNDNFNIKIINNYNDIQLQDNQCLIDKTLIFKSFDVISFVLNKMYDESFTFLNYNVNSLLIFV